VEFVERRLRKAKKILKDAKIPYAGWVTPHYAASPLAIRVIHSNFGRVLQRMRYFVDGKAATPANAIDQFFPYTITYDYYGVYVWPENLGYVPLPRHGGKAQDVDAMLEIARLNKVVRDAWASFFWHPVLIRTELGIRSLEKLVDGIRAEGYEFVSLQELRNRGE
jgi:peptidoglycan/xylan/chitin deacetylase (PgdA/CDA1 family)